jgi:hypothetical protein
LIYYLGQAKPLLVLVGAATDVVAHPLGAAAAAVLLLGQAVRDGQARASGAL